MRFKLILRRSEILPHTPLLGRVVLMVVALLLTHTVQTHTLSFSLQWLTFGTSSQEGNTLKTARERETHPTQHCQLSSVCTLPLCAMCF